MQLVFKSTAKTIMTYSTISEVFKSVIDEHALLKTNKVRGNQWLLMTKQLRKINRFKLRSKYPK